MTPTPVLLIKLGEFFRQSLTSSIQFSKAYFIYILLATTIIRAQNPQGQIFTLRALVDQGGEASAITENAVQLLKLSKTRCRIDVTHLDEAQSSSNGFAFHLLWAPFIQISQ